MRQQNRRCNDARRFLTLNGKNKIMTPFVNNPTSKNGNKKSKILSALLQKVQDQASRAADYLAPTNDLQKSTTITGKPQIIVEQRGGEPTQFFDINDVAFGQIASHADIDTRTARRLQSRYPAEFDGLVNAIWQNEPAVRMIRTTPQCS
jgi:hypothetical protein